VGVGANTEVVRRFYEVLWNQWDLDLAEVIVSPTVRFRGSLGTVVNDRDGFLRHAEQVRAAFPDWHNRIDDLIAVDDRVVARLTWTGTHRGRLGDIEPSGATVSYAGAAFFRLTDGVIEEAWIVGDTQELWHAIAG
jgi:steroid delta-isomerase-like uncharacterized protein